MKDSHIGRRQFVRYSAAGIAAVASAKVLAEEQPELTGCRSVREQ